VNPLSLVLQAVVLFLFAMGTVSFIAMLKGCFFLRRLARSTPRYDGNIILKSPLVSAVSVVVAIPDVSPESREFVDQLLELHFGKHELVLVLDGPTDAELAIWTEQFHLVPSARGGSHDIPSARVRGLYESRDPLRLVVVNKEAGGQADALNAGVNVALSPVIGLVDPLCEFEPTLLLSLIRPMLDDPARTVAVCGVMPPPAQTAAAATDALSGTGLPACPSPPPAQTAAAATDAPKSGPAPSYWAARFGELESLRLWLARGGAFAGWNLLLPVPGASMLVLRDAIVKMGGFRAGQLELFLHLHGQAHASGKQYRVAFVPEGVGHARVPRSVGELLQRNAHEDRDIAGALGRRQSIAGGIGAIGWGLPGIFCVRFVRPLLETAAYALAAAGWLMGLVDPALVGLVLLSTVGLGTVVSMAAVVLRELVQFRGSDPTRLAGLFFATIPENLGYRQIRNLYLIAGFFQSAPQKQNRE